MTCKDTQELFADYLENKLDRPRLSLVKEHLSGCQICQQELAAEKSLAQWLGTRDTEPVSPQFTQMLMGRLGVQTAKPPRWFDAFLGVSNYWAPSLAAILVMIFAGRTILDWIDRAKSLGQQAVGVIDSIPRTSPITQILPESLTSSAWFSSIPVGTILLFLAAGGLGFAIHRLLKS